MIESFPVKMRVKTCPLCSYRGLEKRTNRFSDTMRAECEAEPVKLQFLFYELSVKATTVKPGRQPRGNETRNLRHALLFVNSRGE